MPPLPTELRNKLERVVIEARDVAEAGAQAALEALAVDHHQPYPHMPARQRQLRNQLRARARQLGDRKPPKADKGKDHEIVHLRDECAYEHWHRMLFARFLAENNLLIEPEHKMAVSLAEAEELAQEADVEVWVFASRCAQDMLPRIFRPEDPLLLVSFATEHRVKLENLLASLPAAVFTASDALGWVYQFWQSKKKEEVNRSEVKIGADEISAVTQLFTEPYMVEFLLHNTLGAWWAGKRLSNDDLASANSEDDLRRKLALPGVDWQYLRFVRGDNSNCSAGVPPADLNCSAGVPPADLNCGAGVPPADLNCGAGVPPADLNCGAGVPPADLNCSAGVPPASPKAGETPTPQSAGETPTPQIGPWRPAAGTFDGWPKAAPEIKVLDPCCGSGHFLVAALRHLAPMRMAEEGLSAADAVDAVLRDNLHGLEIDERCCQIAAFALALAAWTFPDVLSLWERAGVRAVESPSTHQRYRELPQLHIACSGIGPQCSADEWLKMAEESKVAAGRAPRDLIHNGLLNLHHLFSQAPILGSLINPTELAADVVAADYETIQPYLTAILEAEKADDETRQRAIAAAGMVKAADLLAGEYTLVITNVPYLGRGKQDDVLKRHLETHYPPGKADVATAFVVRSLDLAATRGTTALVTPQNWLFLTSYRKMRELLLKNASWNAVARLGPRAFDTISGEVVNVALLAITAGKPPTDWLMAGFDASAGRDAAAKAAILRDPSGGLDTLIQSAQLSHPDSTVIFERNSEISLLSNYAVSYRGHCNGDSPRFERCFWEVRLSTDWSYLQSAPARSGEYEGRHHVLFWQQGAGALVRQAIQMKAVLKNVHKRGHGAWGSNGVAVMQMNELPTTLYGGEIFDGSCATVIPNDPTHLPALWTFFSSPEFRKSVRMLNRKTNVENGFFVKIPFDLAHWQAVAAEKFPNGLPPPHSDDPTQWLFKGEIPTSTAPLQAAVARLLGYRWPEQPAITDVIDALADDDGIVCIPSVRGEEPAADQLLALLTACDIDPGVDLDDWLRNAFFEQHCKLFHDRPFIWHIWDGRKRDGFQALVNYHKLCEAGGKGRRLLESLAYAYLGEWITRQRDGVKRGEEGAEGRLAAAVELQNRLKAILDGEPPFDLFVRWKPLARQPIGWEPDINDGVRMNIRPFLASDLPGGRTGAGVLRFKPNVKWTKDRGKEPQRPKDEYPWFWNWDEKAADFSGGGAFDGNRWNACHYTNQVKQAARNAARKDGDDVR